MDHGLKEREEDKCYCTQAQSFEITVKTSRLIAIDYDVGATLTTKGDTCNVLESSPEILFSEKCTARIRMHSKCLQTL